MTCSRCGAAMRLKPETDAFVCDFCGSVHAPEANADGVRVFGEVSGVRCSVCGEGLVMASVGGRQVEYCGWCKGLLVPMDGFAELTQDLRAARVVNVASGRAPAERDLERRIACPRCGAPMDTHRYGGPGNVIIDSCEKCQLNWLDYGELERIVRAPDWPRMHTNGHE